MKSQNVIGYLYTVNLNQKGFLLLLLNLQSTLDALLHANNIVCENIIHSRQSRSHTYKAIYRDDSANMNKNKQKSAECPQPPAKKTSKMETVSKLKLRSLFPAMFASKHSNRHRDNQKQKQSHQHHS
jgi:hypothetical protein